MANIWRLPPRVPQQNNKIATLAPQGTTFTQDATGAMTPAGALLLTPIKLLAGASLRTYYSDTFNRADSDTVGGNWLESVGDWDIISNTVQPTAASASELTNTTAIGSADYLVQVILNPNNTTIAAIIARWVDASNFYFAGISSGNFVIGKVVAGVTTTLATFTTGRASGATDTIVFQLVGDHLVGFYNGTKQLEVVDNTYTLEGRAGLISNGQANVAFDTFVVLATLESNITYNVSKLVSGANTPTGALAKQANVFQTGAISSIVGSLLKQANIFMAGNSQKTYYSDDFNRADNDVVGGNWIESVQDWDIISNTVQPTTTLPSQLTNTTSIGSADYAVGVNLNPSDTPLAGVMARWQDTDNYYALVLVSGNLNLYSIVGGASNLLQSVATGRSAGSNDRIVLWVRGSRLYGFFNGSKLIDVTNTDFTTEGRAGLFNQSEANVAYDNFSVYTGLYADILDTPSKLMSGSIPSAGGIIYQVNKLLSGALTPVGSTFKQANISFSGAITPSGALTAIKLAILNLTGSLTSSGQIVNQVAINEGGSLPPAGTNTLQANKLVAGSVTPNGTDANQANKLFAGTLTLAGTVATTLSRTFTGSIALSGSIIYQVNKLVSGALTPAGSLLKQANVLFSGSITPTGALTAIKLAVLNLTGAITSSGSILRQVNVTKSGSVSPTGIDIFNVSKLIAGASNLSGALATALNKLFSGSLASSGTELRQVNKLVSANLPPSGVTQDQINKFFSGSITPNSTVILTPIAGGVTILIITGTIGSSGELIVTAIPLLCLTDWTMDEQTEFEESGYINEPAPALVPSGFIDTEALKNSDWTI